jgi:hypothetical protein
MEIPAPSDTTHARIFASWEEGQDSRHSRRLGASSIGKECERDIWYSFRWAKKKRFDGRMLRLFNRGHREEPVVCSDLRLTGAEVLELDPDTGSQWEFSILGDHFVCKVDAVGVGFVEAPETWHVIEIKTHNDKSFSSLKLGGVKAAKPEHYAQCMTGMGMSEMTRALYVAVNKDSDELYIERIRFDAKEWQDLQNKARAIIGARVPPEKINNSPAFYKCKFCDHNSICHEMGEVAEKNCRTCEYSDPLDSGGWFCGKHVGDIDEARQKQGCADHRYREGMLPAEAQKALDLFGGKVIVDTGVAF